MYLPGGCTWSLGGSTCPGGVPGPGGCTYPGVYLPGGVILINLFFEFEFRNCVLPEATVDCHFSSGLMKTVQMVGADHRAAFSV